MPEPVIPQKKPYVCDEVPGVRAWCACGKSAKQPYCDGAHAGSGFRPTIVTIDVAKKVAWCGCKKSANPPTCDGSHSRLP